MAIIESAWLNRGNEVELTIYLNGEPLPFQTLGTSKVEVMLGGLTLSSINGDAANGGVSFDNAGKVAFRPGNLVLEVKKSYPAIVVVYDDGHTDGQIIVGDGMEDSNVIVRTYAGS